MYAKLIDTADNSVVMARKNGGVGWRKANGGRNGDICNSVNNKNKHLKEAAWCSKNDVDGSEEHIWFWTCVCGTPVEYAQRTLESTHPL